MADTVTATGLFGSLASTDQDCTDHLGPPTPRVLEHGLKHGREPNFAASDFTQARPKVQNLAVEKRPAPGERERRHDKVGGVRLVSGVELCKLTSAA